LSVSRHFYRCGDESLSLTCSSGAAVLSTIRASFARSFLLLYHASFLDHAAVAAFDTTLLKSAIQAAIGNAHAT